MKSVAAWTQGQCPTIIVLCPVRNEAWILRRFLSVASVIADHIIVADQMSTDRSREICQEFSKVVLIDNPHEYSDIKRERLLIEEARRIPGPRLLLALDADEILSANVLESIEWETMLSCPVGTLIAAPRIELWQTPLYYRPFSAVTPHGWVTFGFMDDGSEYNNEIFCSYPRIPQPIGRPVFRFNDVVILHYQFTDFQRALSKSRWYLCFARVTEPDRDPTEMHRFFTQYITEPKSYPPKPCPSKWFEGWIVRGMDMTSIQHEQYYWWDWEVLRMFEKYGERIFRHEDVWYIDWETIRQAGLEMGIPDLPQRPIKDPRTKLERYLTVLCRRTQNTKWQRLADRVLRLMRR